MFWLQIEKPNRLNKIKTKTLCKHTHTTVEFLKCEREIEASAKIDQ